MPISAAAANELPSVKKSLVPNLALVRVCVSLTSPVHLIRPTDILSSTFAHVYPFIKTYDVLLVIVDDFFLLIFNFFLIF